MADDEGERPAGDDGEAPGTDAGEPGRSEKSGTFLVTSADEASAVLSDVATGQVHPLGANHGFEAGEVAEASLAPEGPLGVTWYPESVAERWRPAIGAVDEPPGERARELADDPGTGRLTRVSIDGGELHAISVEPERTEDAVADVLADDTTLRIAARLGSRRVEVRGADGVVGVRYLR